MSNWNCEKIRNLRLRLGWSHADLARRLMIESQLVQDWEKGEKAPLDSHIQNLEFIEKEAESQAFELFQGSCAEKMMIESRTDQVDGAAVQRYIRTLDASDSANPEK